MPINHNPLTGEVLVCNFGDDFVRTAAGEIDLTLRTPNTRLPPEMVKNRLVVVLNGKMSKACIVVPVTKTPSKSTTTAKYHVSIPPGTIVGHDYFTPQTERWALGEQVQQVSKMRLSNFFSDPQMKLQLDTDLVAQIQRTVVKAINAGSLLAPVDAVTAPPGAATAPKSPQGPMNAISAAMFAATAKKAVERPLTEQAGGASKPDITEQGDASGKEAA